MLRQTVFTIAVICCLASCHSLRVAKRKMRGEPINILVQNANGGYEINPEAIERVLLHPEVKDRSVYVLSIAGAFRKGKSFFLNYCLRFMYANVRYFEHFRLIEFDIYWIAVSVNKLPEQSSDKPKGMAWKA